MFTVPTLAELHQLLVDLATALFPELDTSRASFPNLFAKVVAAGATDNHAHLDAVLADLLPDTAEGDALDRWGAIVGRPRKGATAARKADALRLVNTTGAGVAYTVGAELVHVSGLRFAVNESGTVPANDSKDVDVVAVDTGVATRLAAGEVLTFSTPIAGLEELATLVLDLDEDGTDQEPDDTYRARLLARFVTPPMGGAATDYEQWSIESMLAISSAYCYPTRRGLGTVDVAALHTGSGSARLLTATERASLLAVLRSRAPVGADVGVLETVPETVHAHVLINTAGGDLDWDWNDDTPPIVSSWTPATRTMTFTADRPASMEVGDRIVIRNMTDPGAVHVIEDLVGADSVVLSDTPATTPAPLDTIYAAGDRSVAARAELIARIERLGPANQDDGPHRWDGSLRLSNLHGLVSDVMEDQILSPLANVTPTAYPVADGKVGILQAGVIIVRRLWP